MSKPKLKQVKKLQLDEYAQSLGLSKWNSLVLHVAEAYADCLPENVETEGLSRNLNYFATAPVSASALHPYLLLIGEYNGFRPARVFEDIRTVFGEDAVVFIAREGSPCLYVRPKSRVWFSRGIPKLSCDEFSFEADLGIFRLWWD